MYDRDYGIDTLWENKNEEEKYAEWSRYAEDVAAWSNYPTDSYMAYCNRWDAMYGTSGF